LGIASEAPLAMTNIKSQMENGKCPYFSITLIIRLWGLTDAGLAFRVDASSDDVS
jgi:hypothetical protein